jgi:hypothetical protein
MHDWVLRAGISVRGTPGALGGSATDSCRRDAYQEVAWMLWTIIAVLLILWLLGFTVVHVGGLIHLLLVVALIVLIFQLISGRRAV